MDLSILILTYNRSKFSKLISHNINSQTYGDIKEIIVLDDGDEPLELDVIYNVRYIKKNEKMSIGAKRNFLIKECKTKFFAFMDDDDFYFPTYISHSVLKLKRYKRCKIAASTDMLFYFTDIDGYDGFGHMSCSRLSLPHEACMVGYTKFMKNFKFKNTSAGEGAIFEGFTQYIAQTEIDKCMMCLVHNNNTVPKTKWYKPENSEHFRNLYQERIKIHLDCIDGLFYTSRNSSERPYEPSLSESELVAV